METLRSINHIFGQSLLDLFFESTSRTYWVYLVASLIVVAFLWRPERQLTLAPRERLWTRETWLSKSAVNDYGLILINGLLLTVIFAAILPPPATMIAGAAALFPHNVAPLPGPFLAVAPVLLALCLFLVDDLLRFLVHYAEHRIPVLWEFHKVHHSASVLNFMTAERHHPISSLYTGLILVGGAVLVNGLFVALFGHRITLATMLGGNIFWVAVNMLGSSFRHSPVWISFGPTLEKWLISPAQHQIHHSEDERHWDKNMGGSLAIWDRMAGTLYTTTRERERIIYGIGAETSTHDSLLSIYTRPIMRAAAVLFHRPQPVAA